MSCEGFCYNSCKNCSNMLKNCMDYFVTKDLVCCSRWERATNEEINEISKELEKRNQK